MNQTTFYSLLRPVLWMVLVLLVGMGTFSKRGWMDLRRISKENEMLGMKIQTAHLQRDDLDREIASLQKNTEAQERVIRQVLGYIRPNETVLEFQ